MPLCLDSQQLQPATGYFVVGAADMCEHVRQDWTHVAGLAVTAVVLRFKVAALELAFIHVTPDRVDVVARRCKQEIAAYLLPRALC